jgi:hypothetical protein
VSAATIIEMPSPDFSGWKSWNLRYRPSEDFDVPQDFGILGLYILANIETGAVPADSAAGERHLQPSVVYIGMSTHVERRLERTHKGVAAYRKQFNDVKCERLWYSTWHSPWNNSGPLTAQRAIERATIALYERFLLLEFAKKHSALPELNRR